jgi:threonine/homoserine/homoserine lactone efflux protein
MYAAVLKGLFLGLMLAISVGPIIFSILKQSINNGHKGGFAFIAGVSLSDITIVVLSNVFSFLLEGLLEHKALIGICGSILLITIGIYVTFFKKIAVADVNGQAVEMKTHHYVKIFISGFLMNTLNPGSIGFWLLTSTSLLVHPWKYRLVVFITTLVVVGGFDIAKVMLANSIRERLTPHNIHIINRISGMILIGFGLALIWGVVALAGK